MKYLIKLTFMRGGKACDSQMTVWAEDVRYALRLVET